MCQASPVTQWWECPTSAWESVGYFWHGGYILIFVTFFFTVWNEQYHFQSVQALYNFYFNGMLYVDCYVILLHPGGKHCLITYSAFQKLELASRTSNFENEIPVVFAKKNPSIPWMLYRNWLMWLDSVDWKWNSIQKRSCEPVLKNGSSERVPRVLWLDLTLTCNYCFHGGELYIPIWYAFFLCFRLQTVTWSCHRGVRWQSGRNMLVASGSSVQILTFSMLLCLTLIWTMPSKSSLFSNRCCGSILIFFCFGVC